MASTKLLIIAAVLVAGANAKFVWQDDEDDFFRNPYKIQMPFPPTPPRLPFASFPPFHHFQPFAPFPPFGQNFQFPNFPNFPNIPPPRVLTPEEIKNAKPGPNQMFTGTVVKSQSSVVMGPDGKPIKQGGTTVLTNLDGKVNQYQDGNAPPDLNTPIKIPKMDFPKFGAFPEFEPIKMPKFKPIIFKPIEPIDLGKMEGYTPGEGETYQGASSSSHSSTLVVNGKTVKHEGGTKVLLNDNGKVFKEGTAFHAGDPE